jgi:putative PIG3 family NAD(P)H quinone oxidoreductase
MRVIRITRPGGPYVLKLGEVDDPVPGPGEVRVRVVAAGVNRADLLQRAGRYPAPAGVREDVPGLEFAGVVEAAGRDVGEWHAGARVMGLTAGAAYAEYVVLRADHLLPVPDGWSWEMAAAIPEAYCTAHDALDQVRARQGDRALVHAVGSSVGVALLHLLHARGSAVIGTSRTAWKLERARELGLETGVHVKGTFEPTSALRDSVDVVCDLVGGPYVAGDLECARLCGRIVVIGLSAGRSATLDLGLLLRKRLTLIGTVLRSRSDAEKAAVAAAVREALLPRFASGAVSPVVDRVFPMQDAAEAHRFVESNGNFGSVVLRWE